MIENRLCISSYYRNIGFLCSIYLSTWIMILKQPTILIIEDEEVLLSALTEKLQISGYRVIGVKDGAAGFDLIKAEKPDLILLDLLLPNKNGLAILEDAKNDPETSQIPVIVISNSGQPVEIKKILDLGAKDYLVKAEFEPEEVLQKMEKILGPRPVGKQSVKSAEESIPAEAIRADADKKNETILVVEDDKFLRDLLVEKLNKEGYIVSEVVDGNSALKELQSNRPNLVLLDLILPGIDGFEILRRMQNDSALSKIPVIVLSNLGQQDDMNRAKELGAKHYLIKAHFTLGEIMDKIRSVLRESYF